MVMQTTGATSSQEWQPASHDHAFEWAATFQSLAPWIFGVLVGGLLLRALRNGSRYRAVDALDEAAVERMRTEVAALEQETMGEVAVVVLERSDHHPQAPWAGAVLLTGLATLAFWPLIDRVGIALPLVGLLQVGVGAIAYGVVRRLPDLARLFVTRSRAAEVSEEQAIQEFHALGLRDTAERTGVLLFVSLFERHVVVLADEGIADQVEEGHWIDVDRVILDGAKTGDLEAGLRKGVALVGAELVSRFPGGPGRDNQVVDHVIIRHE